MSDELIIRVLEKLKAYCKSHRCSQCKFLIKRDDGGDICQFGSIKSQLNIHPSSWDIEKIKEVLKK